MKRTEAQPNINLLPDVTPFPDIATPAVIESVLDRILGVKRPTNLRHINKSTQVSKHPNRREIRQLVRDVKPPDARSAGIDKLDAIFYERIELASLRSRAESLGIKHALTRIGPNRNTLAIRLGEENGEHVYVPLTYMNCKYVSKLISNPNRFKSYRSYCTFLIKLFGLNAFEFLKIQRIDFNVDLEMSYHELRKILRVKFKRLYNLYSNRSSEQTGMDYGSGSRKLVFYNKTEQLNSKGIETKKNLARIELRYTGKDVPVEFIKDLPKIAKPSSFERIKFFAFLSLETFTMPDKNDIADRTQLIKLIKFQTYLEAGGLDLAYRKLNTKGNFYRDYKGLVTFTGSPYDLNKILLDNLCDFFERSRVITL